MCVITGFPGGTTFRYYVYNNDRCNSPERLFRTICGGNQICTDFTNLDACQVTATYGDYDNPERCYGVVDGRHTAITTDDTDTNTNNQLHMIPPGYAASVRLGNADIGAQAESISYEYTIDTSQYNVLLLNYAAVMQDPGHVSYHQPRFRLQILDIDGRELDPECYSRDFVAGSNTSDWHEGKPGVLWKNWTTVGIDLDQLHGRTVYIKLTTFDCQEQAHFGYAYFTLECSNKLITSTNCGYLVENTFTAPAGFDYRWYEDSDPTTTLGTEQSFHVTERGTYRCAMSMVGGDTTNNNCGLVMTATAGSRFPYARFTSDTIETVNCQPGFIFRNNSVITTDPNHDTLTAQSCESYLWDFGDGTTSTEVNPQHHYSRNGTYRVMLVAYLSNGACSDTSYRDITVHSNCSQYDTVRAAACVGTSHHWFDTIVSHPGVYHHDSAWTFHTLIMSYYGATTSTVYDTIVENMLPYSFNGTTFIGDMADTVFMLTNTHGCDSILTYSLHVWRNHQARYDENICNNLLPYTWMQHTFFGADSIATTYTAQHGEDSTVIQVLAIRDTSSTEVYDTIVQNQLPWYYNGSPFSTDVTNYEFHRVNAVGCDSIVHYNLYVFRNVRNSVALSICTNNFPYEWNGVIFDTAGIQSVTLLTSHGADSVVVMTVRSKPTYRDSIFAETCNGTPYAYADRLYGTAGVYPVTLTAANECDSVVDIHLTVHPTYSDSILSIICDDSALVHDGRTYARADTYHRMYRTIHGCDSTLKIRLLVRPTYDEHVYLVFCQGSSVDYHDTTYTAAGQHLFKMSSMHGCDSVEHLYIFEEELPLPDITLEPEYATYERHNIRIHDNSMRAVERVWYIDGEYAGDDPVMYYNFPLNRDTIPVQLIVTGERGCQDSTVVNIPLRGHPIYAPNIFTPKRIENNHFCVSGDNLATAEVSIYTRRGALVCSFDGITECWDGTKNGVPCMQGSYTYLVRYTSKSDPGNPKVKTGTVTLIY